MLQDEDWFLRQVMVIAKAIERALDLAGEPGEENQAEAQQQLSELLEAQFDHSKLSRLEPRAVTTVMRPPARVRSYAIALAAWAAVRRQRGESTVAVDAVLHRALTLHLEAFMVEDDPATVDREGIEALLEQLPAAEFEPRHLDALDRLDILAR